MFTRNGQAVIEKQCPDVSIEMIKSYWDAYTQRKMCYLTHLVLWKLYSWEYCKWHHLCETLTLNCNGSPSGGLHILQTNAKLQNVISLAWLFQT